METVYIYGLVNPETNLVRYVGKTVNPKLRLRQHIYCAKEGFGKNKHLDNWINKILRNNQRPILRILEKTSSDCWEKAERKWIRFYRIYGYKLINATSGGDAPEVTEEMRKKIAKSATGKKHSEETKRKIGLESLGRQAMLGHKHTEETKRKISKAKTGRKLSAEHIKNAIDGRKGYRHSEETKLKIGRSNSIANKGKKHSEETKRKMSISQKKRWAKRKNNELSG